MDGRRLKRHVDHRLVLFSSDWHKYTRNLTRECVYFTGIRPKSFVEILMIILECFGVSSVLPIPGETPMESKARALR